MRPEILVTLRRCVKKKGVGQGEKRVHPIEAPGSMEGLRDERDRRKKRRRLWCRPRTRRRAWAVFLAFCFASAAIAFLGPEPPEPVARVEAPESGAAPVPPVVGGGLETRLSQFASVSPGEYGVAVFDARTGRTAEVSAGREFQAASLAKLPVMLALYKEAADGGLDLDEEITMLPGDMTAEGAGVLHTYPAGYEVTLRECAEYLMKESDNTAWLMLERRLGEERVSAELSELGLDPDDYESRVTTPEDVMHMLRAISDPGYTKPSLSEEMLGMMTGTAYEERLPEPLPDDVRVAHKVGTLGDTYSDAGIVFDEGAGNPAGDGYYIVVIASGVEEGVAEEAMRRISLATHEALRPGHAD